MLEQLKAWFLGSEQQDDDSVNLDLACAALLVEVALADHVDDPREGDAIVAAIKEVLTVDEEKVEALVADARSEVKESISVYPYTSLINEQCSPEQKFEIVKAMWKVAFADGDIDRYEMHLIRKVAELIYLPHPEFIRAKIEARDA